MRARLVWSGLLALLSCAPGFGAAGQPVDAVGCNIAHMAIAPQAAIDACTTLLKGRDLTNEQRADALAIRARAYYRTRRIDLAAENFDAVLALAPNNVDAIVSRSSIHFRRGQADLGVAGLRRAANVDPHNPRLLRSTGRIYQLQGDLDTALKYYSRAIEVDAQEPYALLWRSELHAARKRYREALTDADSLIAISPVSKNQVGYIDGCECAHDFHVVALTHRADLFAAIGRHDAARRDLDDAVAFTPSAYALLQRARYRMNQPALLQSALADLDAAIVLDGEYASLHYSRGVVLMTLDRYEEAFAALDEAVELRDGYSGEALFMRARVHRHFGRTEEAVRDFVAAHTHNPSLIARSMFALRHAGFWKSPEVPRSVTPELQDAFRACMIDLKCN